MCGPLWVRAGGALVVIDDRKDPYNHVKEWWNSNGNSFDTPLDHLFQTLGLASSTPGPHHVGKGCIIYQPQNPAALIHSVTGSETVLDLLKTAAQTIHPPLKFANALLLRRGPYVVAAGLDREGEGALMNTASPVSVTGDLINLFDPNLTESSRIEITPGTRLLLLDLNYFKSSMPRVLCASAKITHEEVSVHSMAFQVEGIDQTDAVICILSRKLPRTVRLGGQLLDPGRYQFTGRTLLLHFENVSVPQEIQVMF